MNKKNSGNILNTMKPKTFHDSLKPLIYFNCYVGMGAFRLPNHTNASYMAMVIHTVTFTLIIWATIYFTLSSISELIEFEDVTPMALMMYKALICVNSFITLISPFLVWLRRQDLRECILDMVVLDNNFQNFLGAENEYKKRYVSLISQIIGIFFIMLLVGIGDSLWIMMANLSPLKNLAVLVALHHPIIVMLVLDLNFCFFIGYLGKKFRDLNKSLMGLTDQSNSTFKPGNRLFMLSQNVGKIIPAGIGVRRTDFDRLVDNRNYLLREIRIAHLGLCKLSRKINSAFGIQNLISMGTSFVMVTGLLYTIYSAFEWENFTNSKLNEVIPTLIWAVIYAFKIFIVNHSSFAVSNEAEKSGEIIYELLNSKGDKELQREVQEFGVQMLQNPVRFSARGFFTLDYTFVQGAVGSITTYLVILIQMSHLPESPATNISLPWNTTGSSITDLTSNSIQ